MSPTWIASLLCLMFMGKVVAKDITAEQLEIMRKGLEAGKQFTQVLEKGTFQQFMAKAETFAFDYVEAINMMLLIIDKIVDQINNEINDRILDETIKGFKGVNGKLDLVIKNLGDMKNYIKWQDMKVRFSDIEYRIRLLDDTLDEVFRAPDRKAGMQYFRQVYKSEYSSAGFGLYDAVANNDQVFSQNLLMAAIKFSDVSCHKTRAFSRGLFALIMKATCVEIAYEKFSKMNAGKNVTWIQRMEKSRKAMQAADDKLTTEAWKPQLKIEVHAIAKSNENIKSNQAFTDSLYTNLIQKYPFRNFLVIAFRSTDSTKYQASVLPDHGVRGLKKHKRSYFVVSTDPESKFDQTVASTYAKDYVCEESDCDENAAVWMMSLSPDYGVARMVVADHFAEDWGYTAKAGRFVIRDAALTDSLGLVFQHYKFIYFG